MADTQQPILEQSIVEERMLAALYDLSLGPLPSDRFLDETLARLCQAPNLERLLPAACYFRREFNSDAACFELAAQHRLPVGLEQRFSHPDFNDPRMQQAVEQRTIKLATRLDNQPPATIEGRDIKGIFYLPLGTNDEMFGVILLFIGEVYKPQAAEIKFFKRASRAIGNGLAQRHNLDKWTRAYQDLQLNHIHQFNEISRLCKELALPMSAVSGVAESIAKHNLPAIRDPALLLVNSSNHLKTLVGKLTEKVTYGTRQIDINNRVFSFTESIIRFLRQLRSRVEARGLAFSIHVDSNIPAQLIGDFDKIKSVISILADNAIKFTLAGEVSVSIDVEQQHADRLDVAFSVRDTGMGIPAVEQPGLLRKDGQTPLDNESGAAGIRRGLRLACRYVELMQGRIDLSSRPGAGSHFTFTLPLKLHGASSSGNSVESTLTMEAITVLPQNMVSETERIKRDNSELISALLNGLNRKLNDYDITSDQAIDDIIPVLKNTVYRKDLKAIKTAINLYDFENASSLLQGLAQALGIELARD